MEPFINNATRSFTFPAYKTFVNELAQRNLSTGELSEEHIQATKLNAHRINRIDKQTEIIPQLKLELESLKENWHWIILIESWCGDGAQNVPVIAKIASLSSKIKVTLILRDEHPKIMDAHLTNNARAIPKLICIKENDQTEIGTWGPRPAAIQEMVRKFKSENPSVSHDEFVKNLHLWYSRDKGSSLQKEFITLINEWKRK